MIKIKKVEADARKWLKSSEGKESIRETLQKAREATEKLRKEREVDLKSVREPFTLWINVDG